MLNFSGTTVISGSSIAPLGVYAGSLLLRGGDLVIGLCFLFLTVIYLLIVISTVGRYVINYRRSRYLLDYELI